MTFTGEKGLCTRCDHIKDLEMGSNSELSGWALNLLTSILIRERISGEGFPGGASDKEPACQYKRHKRHRFDTLVGKISFPEKEMATHSSILAWRVPWTEESGGLQSIG